MVATERDECFIIVSDVSAYIEAEVAGRDQCAIKIPQSPALAPAIEVIEKKPSRPIKANGNVVGFEFRDRLPTHDR
jgi:hypothetical protein